MKLLQLSAVVLIVCFSTSQHAEAAEPKEPVDTAEKCDDCDMADKLAKEGQVCNVSLLSQVHT